jgi:lipopolysaccharide transport system permease protein
MARDLHNEERTYTPDSEMRHPWRLLRSMGADLMAGRELAWRLFVRDTAAQYRQSALGYIWVVLPPLATSAIFILLNSANVIVSSDLGMTYPVYVLTGTVFFGLFSDGMAAPLKTIAASRALLIKVSFPREALLLTSWAQTLLGFVIRMALLAICLIPLHASIASTAPLVVIPALGLMLFGIMVGVLMVPLGALYQDITLGIVLLTSALMLVTPVAFAAPTSGALATIMHYNPLSPLVLCARDLLITGDTSYLPATLVIMGICLVLFVVGWVMFRLAVPIIIERLGS